MPRARSISTDRAGRLGPIVAAVLALLLAAPIGGEEPPGLAVMSLADETENEWWVFQGADSARDLFVRELTASGKYRVPSREEVDSLLQEHKLTAVAGEITPASAVKAGRLLGVRYLATGTLREFGSQGRKMMGLRPDRSFSASFDVRLIDTETGKVVWADSSRTQATVDRPPKRKHMNEPEFYERMFDRVLRPIVRELVESLASSEIASPSP